MAECITECTTSPFILHPFFGLVIITKNKLKSCAIRYITDNSIIKTCNDNENIYINTLNCITPIVNYDDYLEYYYKLYSIEDVIKYININIHLKENTINRLYYFVITRYVTFLKDNIISWIELTSICLKRIYNININSKINIADILFKIQSIYYETKTYEINYLLVIKNILDDII